MRAKAGVDEPDLLRRDVALECFSQLSVEVDRAADGIDNHKRQLALAVHEHLFGDQLRPGFRRSFFDR